MAPLLMGPASTSAEAEAEAARGNGMAAAARGWSRSSMTGQSCCWLVEWSCPETWYTALGGGHRYCPAPFSHPARRPPNLTSDGLKLTNVRPSEVNALSSDGARWGCGPAPAALGAKFQPAPPRTRCCWEHVLSRGRVLRGRGGGDFKSSNCCCECCDCVRSSLAHRIHASAVSCGRRWQNTHDGLPARGGTRA